MALRRLSSGALHPRDGFGDAIPYEDIRSHCRQRTRIGCPSTERMFSIKTNLCCFTILCSIGLKLWRSSTSKVQLCHDTGNHIFLLLPHQAGGYRIRASQYRNSFFRYKAKGTELMGAEELQRFLKREQSEQCSLNDCQQLIRTLTESTHEVVMLSPCCLL